MEVAEVAALKLELKQLLTALASVRANQHGDKAPANDSPDGMSWSEVVKKNPQKKAATQVDSNRRLTNPNPNTSHTGALEALLQWFGRTTAC